jgi:hypothetical protein
VHELLTSEQGVCESRMHQVQRELYKTPDLVADIKRRNLEWLGHVIKMDQTGMVKKNF